MPAPDRMLTTLRRAREHVLATPGRRGYLVDLQDCDEILVAGDLHGHLANFQVILQAAALAAHPRRHLVFQEMVHGPYRYPKGGDKSHQLVDLFAALKCQFPSRVHYLPGNHEMAQMTGRPIGKGEDSCNALFARGLLEAYGAASAEINTAYNDLFRALPLAYRTANRVLLAHTMIPEPWLPSFHPMQLRQEAFAESEYQPGGVVYGLLWGRDTSQETAEEFLRKLDADWLVSGHIATDEGYLVPNRRQLILECSETPGAFVLFPCTEPISLERLVQGVTVIQ